MVKVLLANSPFGGGGITTFATELIACLSADTELTVVLGDDKKAPIQDSRVKVIYHDTMTLNLNNALYFINLINNVVKPDVVIVSTAIIIPVIVPYLNDNVRVMTVSHSGRFFFTKYCAVNNQYLDKIVAASSVYNKQYLERRFRIKDKNKIRVIYNFVADDDEFESLRFKKKDQKPFSIVYAGASSVHKSPELVAKIVRKLLETDLKFNFYWTGNTQIPLTGKLFKHSALKDVKQVLPNDNRLIFTGRIPSKKEYDILLGSANIFLAPSKNEGCSMATLEAHRSGSILIVGDYKNSNREIVEACKSGFVINHKDVDAFVGLIKEIITHHPNYYHIYEDSHEAFKSTLSYPVWKEKIFNVINGESAHKKRKKRAAKLRIRMDILKMYWLERTSSLERFLCFSLPCFLSFRKQYNEFVKNTNKKAKQK